MLQKYQSIDTMLELLKYRRNQVRLLSAVDMRLTISDKHDYWSDIVPYMNYLFGTSPNNLNLLSYLTSGPRNNKNIKLLIN